MKSSRSWAGGEADRTATEQMRHLTLPILIAALATVSGCGSREALPPEAPDSVAPTAPEPAPEQLWLVVELDDLYNHDVVIPIPVQPGDRFEKTVSNGATRNTLRGRVDRASGGRHPVSVEVTVRPPRPAGEIVDRLEANLKPAEPYTGGAVASLGIARRMTLLSLPPDADPTVAYAELPKPRLRVTPPQLPPRARGR